MAPILQLQGLSKSFGAVTVADDLSYEMQSGEALGIIGPNGAGKSTVIGIITTLVNITSGEVKVYGKDIMQHPEITKQMIGVVPKEYNLNQFIPIIETMVNIGGYFGLSKKQALSKTQELFEDLGIWHKRESTPRELSGGMKRRLLMAKALVHQPPIVILDEPTAGVDVELRQNLWKNVKLLNELGVTIILTTHYLEEAEEMCGRIAILNKGNIVALDSTKNLLDRIQTKKVTFKTDIKININDDDLESLKIISHTDNEVCVSYEKSKINMGELINVIKKNNIKIIDISTDDGDLEDVFLRLIKN